MDESHLILHVHRKLLQQTCVACIYMQGTNNEDNSVSILYQNHPQAFFSGLDFSVLQFIIYLIMFEDDSDTDIETLLPSVICFLNIHAMHVCRRNFLCTCMTKWDSC